MNAPAATTTGRGRLGRRLAASLVAVGAWMSLASGAGADLLVAEVQTADASRVLRKRAGAATFEPLTIGDSVAVGDVYECPDTGTRLGLGSRNGDANAGTSIWFIAPFLVEAEVEGPGATAVGAFRILGGEMFSESNLPVRARAMTGSGEVVIVSLGTSYVVRVVGVPPNRRVEAVVLDGEVAARSTRGEVVIPVSSRLVLAPGGSADLHDLPEEEAWRLAGERARIDIRRAGAESRDRLPELQQGYFDVFRKPDDAQARLDLMLTMQTVAAPPQAMIYQISKVPETTNPTMAAQRYLGRASLGLEPIEDARVESSVEVLQTARPEKDWRTQVAKHVRPEKVQEQRVLQDVLRSTGPLSRELLERLPSSEADDESVATTLLRALGAGYGRPGGATGLARKAFSRWDESARSVRQDWIRRAWTSAYAPPGSGFVPAREWSFLMIERGLLREAIQGFELRLAAARHDHASPDARDLYGMGRALASARDLRAREWMTQALRANGSDGPLSEEQVRHARRVLGH